MVDHPATGAYGAADNIYEEIFMRRALELAERGRGRVSPNLLVGCVLVKDGQIVGEGWHRQARRAARRGRGAVPQVPPLLAPPPT